MLESDVDGDFSPICTAPYVVMDFDPAGFVQACCVNAMYPLGNVADSSIREIWEGKRARTLRQAIERSDLGYGCGVCRHRMQFDAGDPASWYYNNYPAPEPEPEWPYLMAFALHNTCNAACIMCGGDLSSKIRVGREGRPPLPHLYGDRFFEELEEFLPHLGVAEFRGGEPFLIPEHRRIWDSLIHLDHRIPCNFTTNGSVYNDLVESVMAELPCSFMISIDGTTRETLESVRVGVSWDKLMTNIPRFLSYTRERGTGFELSCCALQQNWQELPDIFRFAADLGVPLNVQPVLDQRFGLHRLPTDELTSVARELGAESASLELHLDPGNRTVWHDFLGWLDQELRQRAAGEPLRIFEFPNPTNARHVGQVRSTATDLTTTAMPDNSIAVAVASPERRRTWRSLVKASRQKLSARTRPEHSSAQASPGASSAPSLRSSQTTIAQELAAWSPAGSVGYIHTDPADRVIHVDLLPFDDIDLAHIDVQGHSFEEVLTTIAQNLEAEIWIAEEAQRGDRIDHTIFFGRSEFRDKTGMVMRIISAGDGDGGIVSGFAFDTVLAPQRS